MDHEFAPSLTDAKVCIHCKRGLRDHTAIAQCEACPKVGKCELFADMLLCAACYAAELKAVADYQAPELQEARLQAYKEQQKEKSKLDELVGEATRIDQSIQLTSDFFNAGTIALVELLKAFDEDESVTNKPFAKAEFTVNRIKSMQQALFDKKQEIVKLENEIRANQVHLNQQANQLRAEEREKLKIQDINYQPATPKTPKPKTTSGTKAAKKSSKVDMAEITKWAAKVVTPAFPNGVPVQLVHMRMLAKNMSAEQAARTFANENGGTIKD